MTTTWNDVLDASIPVMCNAQGGGTIGASWRMELQIVIAGSAPTLATWGVTGVCTVYASRSGGSTPGTTLAVAVDDNGVVTMTKPSTETATLAPNTGAGWALRLTNPAAGPGQQVAQIFGAAGSPFPITQEG